MRKSYKFIFVALFFLILGAIYVPDGDKLLQAISLIVAVVLVLTGFGMLLKKRNLL